MNVGRTADRPWAALQGYDGQQTSEYNAGVTKLQQYKKRHRLDAHANKVYMRLTNLEKYLCLSRQSLFKEVSEGPKGHPALLLLAG